MIKKDPRNGGFTLAELLVATVLLSIVMGSVYSLFNTTIHGWRLAESDFQSYQEVRLALSKFESEVENLFQQGGYLFEGDRHSVTMFVIAEPMDLKAGGGRRIMKVCYRYRSGQKELVREEQQVEASLPARPPAGTEIKSGSIKLGGLETFTLAENITDFELRYLWVPHIDRGKEDPPQWMTPAVAETHAKGWGLPHGIEVTITVASPEEGGEETIFTTRVLVRTERNKKTVSEVAYMVGAQ